ncbi:MAG: pirin family protein [Desulfuromonadales bacterium]|jgi:redox-sensitive bicupin YhaK (pirin superfamily)|nr:pirin family protein [Desulfuromonadales bacterium]
MSDLIGQKTACLSHIDAPCSVVKLLLKPKEKDLDKATVRRLMPTTDLRSVGPFVFFDHLGPAVFAPGKGIDVRPHPHIGLATITYVFAGEILHRDSLGEVQPIRPNEINWMTAGRGIVHSERTPPELRAQGHILHALQLWVALPEADQETDPAFYHYASQVLPLREEPGRSVRVMIGEAFGLSSEVRTWSPTLYAEVNLKAGRSVIVPDQVEERAAYVISGEVTASDISIPRHTMAVFDCAEGIELTARQDSRLVFIGGTPLGKRTVWWNLVSTRKELIEKAKQNWRENRFAKVPGETEFIPLPD